MEEEGHQWENMDRAGMVDNYTLGARDLEEVDHLPAVSDLHNIHEEEEEEEVA